MTEQASQRFWAGSTRIVRPFNMTGLTPESLLNGPSLQSMSSKKAAMERDPYTVTRLPTSSGLDVSSMISSSPQLTASSYQ